MSPHKLAYGWIQAQPVAMVTMLGILLGLLPERDKGRLFQHGIAVVQLLFVVWMAITTTTALNVDDALVQADKVMKIQLAVFLSYLLVNTKKKLHGLIWVMFLSVGFYGIKGGLFTIRTAGGQRVWGPDGSFISDNNHLACALLMTMPIGAYLMSTISKKWTKNALIAAIVLIGVSILGSGSRGAFLGLIAVCLFWIKKIPGRQKIMAIAASVVFALIALLFMPQSWWDRMHTVKTYEQDASAMGRINAWWCAFNLAKDRVTGGGFNYYSPEAFALYAPNPTDVHAAHSIYFQILGDHGFIGIFLFLLIAVWAWQALAKIIRDTQTPDLKWANDLAKFMQLSFIAYFSAGAFLSLAYYDLYWQLVAIVVILNTLVTSPKSLPASSSAQAQANAKKAPRLKPFIQALD